MVSQNVLKDRFLNSFQNADALEVNGFFIRHFDNSVHEDTGDGQELIIEVTAQTPDGELDFFVSADELDAVSLAEDGSTWTIAGVDVSFYSVSGFNE